MDVLHSSVAWMDGLWDEEAGLLWSVRRDGHMVRETAWYALGLLQRASDGDAERAARALTRVVEMQFDEPGAPYHGTFRRAPEESEPPPGAVMWLHYDPNWRQFVGVTFAVICDRFADMLPAGVVQRMHASSIAAAESEPPERVSPLYANIALLKAWHDWWSGRTAESIAFAREIAGRFSDHGAFLEYNSPTYYGIDLWALELWRACSDELAELGAGMSDALWRDVARFYHAGLRNVCGPYDRAYGMDMTRYATPLGIWIWTIAGAAAAPFPDPAGRIGHAHDFCFAPCATILPASPPPDAVPSLRTFTGERIVSQVISNQPRRTATAWLTKDVMLGGHEGPPSGIGVHQHHHATIHWRRPDGSVGWVRMLPDTDAAAVATPGRLHITSRSPITFEVHPPAAAGTSGWTADGLSVHVDTDASGLEVGDGGRIRYVPQGPETTLVLEVQRTARG